MEDLMDGVVIHLGGHTLGTATDATHMPETNVMMHTTMETAMIVNIITVPTAFNRGNLFTHTCSAYLRCPFQY